MVRAGCSLRNAAKNAGVTMAGIYYARRTDPAFAEQLRAAEKHRDVDGISRINNAGDKSWRAAAWILEHASPRQFARPAGKKATTPKHLRKRPLKKLMKSIAFEALVEWLQAAQKAPLASRGLDAIDDRLAEIENLSRRVRQATRDENAPDDTEFISDGPPDDVPDDDFDNDDRADDEDVDALDDDIKDADDDDPLADEESPEAADATTAYQSLLRLLRRR
jgi:hypothetical protein